MNQFDQDKTSSTPSEALDSGKPVAFPLSDTPPEFDPSVFSQKAGEHGFADITSLEEACELFGRVAKDPVTGAFTKHFFIGRVNGLREEQPDDAHDLICLEIESYDLVRGRYSNEVCDGFVGSMVNGLTSFFLADAIVGRMDDAHIVFYIPHVTFDAHEQMMEACLGISEQSPYPSFDIRAGICAMNSKMSVEDAYDRCLLAIEGIRFSPTRFIAECDEALCREKAFSDRLERDMHDALDQGQFVVWYQPKFNLDGTRLMGAEALVRWNHPEFGFLTPNRFMALFEKNGFIFELDKYVVSRVCEDLHAWSLAGIYAVPVSVNISQTDFDQATLPAILEEIVDSLGVSHDLVHFEITESSEAPDAMKKVSAVDDLRRRGFAVELDDFGAGYSTLGVLRSMPVDVVKTDISLVSHLEEPESLAILECTLLMVDRLGLDVVVEGVETKGQLDVLTSFAKESPDLMIQGFVFSRPICASDFKDLLKGACHAR